MLGDRWRREIAKMNIEYRTKIVWTCLAEIQFSVGLHAFPVPNADTGCSSRWVRAQPDADATVAPSCHDVAASSSLRFRLRYKQEAHQLMTKRLATQLENLYIQHTISVSLVMISRQTLAELFDSLLAWHTLRTFMQCSVTFCSWQEAASDLIMWQIYEADCPRWGYKISRC